MTAIFANGAGGDAKVGNDVFPLDIRCANSQVFSVFSFPLLSGNPANVLDEPYTIVLTEKTAKKLFGTIEVSGRIIRFDSTDYTVSGIMKDIPPATYLFFERVILADFKFHAAIGFVQLFSGLFVVMGIALLLIGSQTAKVAGLNPADVLKAE